MYSCIREKLRLPVLNIEELFRGHDADPQLANAVPAGKMTARRTASAARTERCD
jgi:hypothetical protein